MQVKECVFKTTDIILGFSNSLWKFCGMEAKYMESQERKEIPEILSLLCILEQEVHELTS
jgi:hypothetical protein